MKKSTKKSKQGYFTLNRWMSRVKPALLIGPMFMLFFWYVCMPGTLYDVAWKDIILMMGIGWVVSVIYLVLLWIAPINLEAKRKEIEESLVQNALRISEAEQRGHLRIAKKLQEKQEQLQMQMRVINM